ncbi:MAG TPA: rhodanese-like domain-containing protein [Arenimonas sp.]|nr:rhodanese-like domain-containing protein [Arenimonas sp.]
MRRHRHCATTLLLGLALPMAALAGKPAVSPAAVEEVSRRADAPLLLDVRSPEEFAAGHVPGAVNIPHDQVAGRLSELDGRRWVLVYCQSGRRAGIAEGVLAQAGFDVRQVDGSWARWKAEGRPVQAPAAEVTAQ